MKRILSIGGIAGIVQGYDTKEAAIEGRLERREPCRRGMEMKKNGNQTETMRMEIESRSENEEFARVAAAVFLSRLDPTVEELDDIKTAVSEAVTNAVIHG